MSDKNKGPVMAITKGLINQTYYDVLDHMIEKNMIKPSSKLFIESFLTSYNILVDHVDDQNVYIRPFASFDMLVGKPNPDFNSKPPIKMAIPTKYKKIKQLQSWGMICEFPSEQIPDHYVEFKNVSFYKLQFPTLQLEEPVKTTTLDHRSSEYRKALKSEMEVTQQMPFAFADTQLQKMGSYEFLANFLNRCIRPDKSTTQKTINNEFNVPVPGEQVIGSLKVTTTTLETAEILLAEDMLVVDYVLSVILERLQNSEGITLPIENRFRFDYATILADFDIPDSGGYRDGLNKQFERIFATDFNIVSCPKTVWLMEKLGFVDSEGKPYDTVSIRLLSPIGQRNDELSEEFSDMLKNRKVNRFIDLSLPEHLIQQINKSLSIGQRILLPMFTRDKLLIQQKDPGIPWLLNNFLSQKCPRPGFKYGPVELKSFCKLWMKAWETDEESTKGVNSILKMLLTQGRLLYVDDLVINSRKQPRLNLLYAKIDKYLIRVENQTPEKKQFGRITYTFLSVRMSDAEIREANSRIDLVKQHPEYAQDHMYKSVARNIIAKSDVVAQQYKK